MLPLNSFPAFRLRLPLPFTPVWVRCSSLPPAGSFPEEVCRRDPGHFLEEAGEVVRELVAQEVRGFVDIVAVHQEVLALKEHSIF